MTVQRQRNGYDCGVFAIANATALAFGRFPSQEAYDARKNAWETNIFHNFQLIMRLTNKTEDALSKRRYKCDSLLHLQNA